MSATALLVAALAIAPNADSVSRAIRYRVDLPVPLATVWAAWTDPERIKEGFAPGSNIELRPFGKYEILFAPTASPGLRGAENNIVLAVQAPEMLAFTWDAPPNLPLARMQRTSVVVRLQPIAANVTRVWFEQTGWGRGGEWDKSYDYFLSAWKTVLALLHRRHVAGPIDWSHIPSETTMAQHARQVSAW